MMKYGFRPVVTRLHFDMPNSSCHVGFALLPSADAMKEMPSVAAAMMMV